MNCCSNISRYLASGSLLICACLVWGCTTTNSVPVASLADPMGGVNLELFARLGSNAAALYRVKPDGRISFGGGMKATSGAYSWHGQLSPAECDELLQILQTAGWYDRNPQSSGLPEDHEYRGFISWPSGRKRWEVNGESPDIRPVYDWLDHVSRRRFDEYLDLMPRPGKQPD